MTAVLSRLFVAPQAGDLSAQLRLTDLGHDCSLWKPIGFVADAAAFLLDAFVVLV
ncbi:hypothetical protein LV779_35905 [Streptomyces thinghirensis]|nr:hypothetical protein [Streptomyces thinghirensis]